MSKPLPSSFPILCALAIGGILVGSGRAEDLSRPSQPGVHPLSRYLPIWNSGWFATPDPAPIEDSSALPVDETPFPYKVVGLADWNGRQWAYLSDENGRIVELSFGLPSQGLILIRIEEDQGGSGDAIVHLRQGSRMIPLRLTHGASFAEPPHPRPQNPIPLGTPERPYANWSKRPETNPRTTGLPGHRVPGTTPKPPGLAKQP